MKFISKMQALPEQYKTSKESKSKATPFSMLVKKCFFTPVSLVRALFIPSLHLSILGPYFHHSSCQALIVDPWYLKISFLSFTSFQLISVVNHPYSVFKIQKKMFPISMGLSLSSQGQGPIVTSASIQPEQSFPFPMPIPLPLPIVPSASSPTQTSFPIAVPVPIPLPLPIVSSGSIPTTKKRNGTSANRSPPMPLPLMSSPRPPTPTRTYKLEIVPRLVGQFIGVSGKHLSYLNKSSGAYIRAIDAYDHSKGAVIKICTITGTDSQIEQTLQLIRTRFPENQYPDLSIASINHRDLQVQPKEQGYEIPYPFENPTTPTPSPYSFPLMSDPIPPPSSPLQSSILLAGPDSKLPLVEGVLNDVRISAFRNEVQLSLQQPTHPTFPHLDKLQDALSAFYNNNGLAPGLFVPFNRDLICVAPTINGSWVRAQVVCLVSAISCVVRYLDTGKVSQVDISKLRQIHVDFLPLPFQSTDCKLYGIQTKRNSSATDLEKYMRPLLSQTLQASVIGYDAGGVPLIHLYRMGENQVPIQINQELVDLGLARSDNDPEPLGTMDKEDERYTDAYVAHHAQAVEARKRAAGKFHNCLQ